MREYSAYEESHIVTSRHSIRDSAGGDFQIPADAEVETKHHCVVYDSCTESLSDKESKYALGSPYLNSPLRSWPRDPRNPLAILCSLLAVILRM